MPSSQKRIDLWKFASAGMELIIVFGVFLGGGLMLDRWLGTRPAFTLAGAVVGFAGGLWRLVRAAMQAQKHGWMDDDAEDGKSGGEKRS